MKRKLVMGTIGLSGIIVALFFVFMSPTRAAWLHGTWECYYDPHDPNPKETLEFKSNGAVVLGGDFYCTYAWVAVKSGSVFIECEVNDEKRELEMKIGDQRQTLINPSGAEYRKQ